MSQVENIIKKIRTIGVDKKQAIIHRMIEQLAVLTNRKYNYHTLFLQLLFGYVIQVFDEVYEGEADEAKQLFLDDIESFFE